jgi:Na+-transporting NADH:ubiquinone oxidoreductase subunit A
MAKVIAIKKGLDINLFGEADKNIVSLGAYETVAVKPTDFIDVTPKMLVKEGDEVLAGTPLFFDKANEAIQFCSPVSGEVLEIERGDKRKILAVKILADMEIKYSVFDQLNLKETSAEKIIEILLKSGAWPFIRQRPYGTIADPHSQPKSIFISGFDTNPLGPDVEFFMDGSMADFQVGCDALGKLTNGKIHLNIKANRTSVFNSITGVEISEFTGPHPAGNVGVQIHHIDPINKGEIVWFISPQDVAVVGRIFSKGKFDTRRVVAVTGSRIKNPQYYNTILGASIKQMLGHAGLHEGDNRIISGSVLSGTKTKADGYVGFYDSQITVIPEGHEPEFIGWLKPGLEKLSVSRAFFSWLTPKRKYDLTTNLHGEERPFVMTGQYEKVFPMDIYPVQLLKSILVDDIEMMEKLGIYEVLEEDFALCEFICTSKIESQQIIRRGLDMIRQELG